MTPYDLIGRGYRLGADFVSRPEGDCLSLARAVLTYYGVETPEPQRSWYRRLRKGDTAVFYDELERWGVKTTDLECGVVALCRAENGYGMAAWFEEGWLNYAESVVRWSPIGAPQVVALYCPRK
jgi:hypothetical protein